MRLLLKISVFIAIFYKNSSFALSYHFKGLKLFCNIFVPLNFKDDLNHLYSLLLTQYYFYLMLQLYYMFHANLENGDLI